MSRPETYDDLTDWQRQGHLVAIVPSDNLTRYPSLGQHLLAAIAEADRLGLLREPDGSLRIPLTVEELDAKLDTARRSWDYNAERYARAATGDAGACPPHLRWAVDEWAKAEVKDPVDWAALDAGTGVRLAVTL